MPKNEKKKVVHGSVHKKHGAKTGKNNCEPKLKTMNRAQSLVTFILEVSDGRKFSGTGSNLVEAKLNAYKNSRSH
jgi:hypothetical protein